MHTKSLILTKCNTCSSRSTLVLSRETILSYFSLEITFALFFFKRNSMWFSNAILCLALQSDPRRIVCGVWRTILEWTGFILELAANVGILKMGSPFQNRADSKNAQNIYTEYIHLNLYSGTTTSSKQYLNYSMEIHFNDALGRFNDVHFNGSPLQQLIRVIRLFNYCDNLKERVK